ncbi:MAG: LytTR family DNA-binding domain-containing protein [Lachnospiraceae bacterium]|nr:LytTR family DNA-binding domain-containing protein [Lachnospiraceae bacterium]
MVRIGICDDDRYICSQLEDILLKYANQNYIKLNIEVFYSGESILNYLDKDGILDLIYLDIELEKINGIDVGYHIRKLMKNYTIEIVYVSGRDGYYRQLFDVQPLNFIEKPINAYSVIDMLELVLDKMKKADRYFNYQKYHDIYKVEINNILYFESLNREIKIVTANMEDYFYGKLEDISTCVSSYPFLKIHRSYLINYNHVTILKYSEVIMSNGTILPISRNRRQVIRNLQINKEQEKADEY